MELTGAAKKLDDRLRALASETFCRQHVEDTLRAFAAYLSETFTIEELDRKTWTQTRELAHLFFRQHAEENPRTTLTCN